MKLESRSSTRNYISVLLFMYNNNILECKYKLKNNKLFIKTLKGDYYEIKNGNYYLENFLIDPYHESSFKKVNYKSLDMLVFNIYKRILNIYKRNQVSEDCIEIGINKDESKITLLFPNYFEFIIVNQNEILSLRKSTNVYPGSRLGGSSNYYDMYNSNLLNNLSIIDKI